MPYVILERPPLFVARRTGFASPEDMAFLLSRAHASLTQVKRGVMVYDAGNDAAGRPDARSRRLTAAWMAEHEALLKERCAGVDFAFPNALSRGVLTAIFWLKVPPFPTTIHNSCRAALASAARRLQAPLDIQDVLTELDLKQRRLGLA